MNREKLERAENAFHNYIRAVVSGTARPGVRVNMFSKLMDVINDAAFDQRSKAVEDADSAARTLVREAIDQHLEWNHSGD